MHTNKQIWKRLLFYIVLSNSLSLYSINYAPIVGARSAGMSHCSVGLKDYWSVFNNPAMMTFYDRMSVGIFYDNRFLLKETSTSCLGYMLPVEKAGVFGVHVLHFGHVNYGELNAGISYAKCFANVFAFGLRFDYLLNYFGDAAYGKCSGFTFEIGMYAQVTKSVGIGFHVFNPAHLTMSTYNDTKEYIPTILRLGCSYEISKKCLLLVDIEKDMDMKTLCRLGVEYTIINNVYLRGGLSFPDFEFALGVGWKSKLFSIDVASTYHTVLGYSPQLSMILNLK